MMLLQTRSLIRIGNYNSMEPTDLILDVEEMEPTDLPVKRTDLPMERTDLPMERTDLPMERADLILDAEEMARNMDGEKVDLQNMPMDKLLEHLGCCTRDGFSSEKRDELLKKYGPNKIREKQENKTILFLSFIWNPLSWLLMVAAFYTFIFAMLPIKPPWQDIVCIFGLLVVSCIINFIEETNAGNAAAALTACLPSRTEVLRSGTWGLEDNSFLVPGDIIKIKPGDVIPADVHLLHGESLKIDQSILTGECFPVIKNPGKFVYSGSICKEGRCEAVVYATGIHTYFGKALHLICDDTDRIGHFQKILTSVGNFCICITAIGMVVGFTIMLAIQKRQLRHVFGNLLALLIGGIPISMPSVLSMTMTAGNYMLAKQGAIAKRNTVVVELAAMDVLFSDRAGTLTLNKLSVYKDLIKVFADGVDKDLVLLLAARASSMDGQDDIDAALVGMLSESNEARVGIREIHFQPFNPIDKRSTITYVDSCGDWHRVSKGAPEQIIALCNCKEAIKRAAHSVIETLGKRGFLLVAVARQEVPAKSKNSLGAPWQFIGLLPLFDPPRTESAQSISRALNVGVNMKMITGDPLAIAKETGRRLGMGKNIYPASLLCSNSSSASLSADQLIEMADGFSDVLPEHKYEIVKKLQKKEHVCGLTGCGVNDALALKKADIGIAVFGATDAAVTAADIALMEPGLDKIIDIVLTSRVILQRMKNYSIYAVSISIRIVLGCMLISLIWKFDFSPIMILVMVILNDGTIMIISKDRVKPFATPVSWELKEILLNGIVFGCYLTAATVLFFWVMKETEFFSMLWHVRALRHSEYEMMAALYLQVSILSQALIFVIRPRFSLLRDGLGLHLTSAFVFAQSIATLIAVYANWDFAHIKGIGWGWAVIIWLYNLLVFMPLNVLKLTQFKGSVWSLFLSEKIFFSTKKYYGGEKREAKWVVEERDHLGLQPNMSRLYSAQPGLSDICEKSRRRVMLARFYEATHSGRRGSQSLTCARRSMR